MTATKPELSQASGVRMLESKTLRLLLERAKHEIVGSCFESAVRSGQRAHRIFKGWRSPELRELFEEAEKIPKILTRLLSVNSCCVDVGCHLGSVLNQFLRLAPHGKHVAFEPMPRKAQWLRTKFPTVRVHSTAVGNESGLCPFYVSSEKSALCGLSPFSRRDKCNGFITVQKTTLDESFGIDEQVDFIKVDVEGNELHVLEGATRLLKSQRPSVLFESTIEGLKRSAVQPRSVFRFLRGLEYNVFVPGDLLIAAPPLSEEQFERCHVYPFRAFNFFAIPSRVNSLRI